jgi:hypothetical protein
MESFLARVAKVYPTNEKFYDRIIGDIAVYNDNKTFTKEDGRLYGAITYAYQDAIFEEDIAFPFDKNNFTFPIKGETVIILKIENETFYLPYSNVPYSNYREKTSISAISERTSNELVGNSNAASDLKNNKNSGGTYTKNKNTPGKENRGGYNVNEKIKFLQPKDGDTIISGRVGNTIRFSEFFLTEDGKSSSPSIFIRNKQNAELDAKPIGTLVDEDINKDGTSVYMTSGKVKIPFKETITKAKIAFKDFPTSDKLKGDQLFINSDRIILSAKASEFIIFGKGNTGVITDGRYSVDAANDIYLHTTKNITIHSTGANQIFFNSDNGKIYLGKNKGEGAAGADVQKMVLGGELVKLMGELIDAINNQIYATPVGPSFPGPTNRVEFDMIKYKLNNLLSSTNFLSK